jgi:hypothetical protein
MSKPQDTWDEFMQDRRLAWHERVRVRTFLAWSLCIHVDDFKRPGVGMCLDDDGKPEWYLKEFVTDTAVARTPRGVPILVSYQERWRDPTFSHLSWWMPSEASRERLGL